MGYTNYWYQYRDFTDNEWMEIVDYFNTLMEKEEYRKLVDIGSKDYFNNYEDQEIYFDGGEGGSCETFVLNKHEPKPRYEGDKTYFNFCKTQGLPYDKVVWKLLKFIKLIVLDPTKADFVISNDNGDEIVSISDTVTLDTNLSRENFDHAYKWTTAPQKSRYEIAKSRAINTKHLVEEKE
jgi:hypothetical protein